MKIFGGCGCGEDGKDVGRMGRENEEGYGKDWKRKCGRSGVGRLT